MELRNLDALELGQIFKPLEPLVSSFIEQGHQLYVVGGFVRDYLTASGTFGDFDFTTDAEPEQIKQIMSPISSALWLQGEKYGTIGGIINDVSVEITTHRTEVYTLDSRKPEVGFGVSITDDLSRRDFTINSLALCFPDFKLIDPFGGLSDLKQGVLKTPIEPDVSFADDPLRIIRAARFLAKMDLTPSVGLAEAAKEKNSSLSTVAPERVQVELEKIFSLDKPQKAFEFLIECGSLQTMFGNSEFTLGYDSLKTSFDVNILSKIDLDPLGALSSASSGVGSKLVKRAGFFFVFSDLEVLTLMKSLRFSQSQINHTSLFVKVAKKYLQTDPAKPLIRETYKRIGSERIGDFWQFLKNISNISDIDFASIQALFTELETSEDLDLLVCPLSGNEIMDLLALDPGPQVGQVVAQLENYGLENGPISREEALKLLRDDDFIKTFID